MSRATNGAAWTANAGDRTAAAGTGRRAGSVLVSLRTKSAAAVGTSCAQDCCMVSQSKSTSPFEYAGAEPVSSTTPQRKHRGVLQVILHARGLLFEPQLWRSVLPIPNAICQARLGANEAHRTPIDDPDAGHTICTPRNCHICKFQVMVNVDAWVVGIAQQVQDGKHLICHSGGSPEPRLVVRRLPVAERLATEILHHVCVLEIHVFLYAIANMLRPWMAMTILYCHLQNVPHLLQAHSSAAKPLASALVAVLLEMYFTGRYFGLSLRKNILTMTSFPDSESRARQESLSEAAFGQECCALKALQMYRELLPEVQAPQP
eukprot:CAMPEP_0115240546 /NCGR_PEP_ID=MMETSP0270-20121206/37968_1 /TAXON_ID=71861 /ORGANISM="Scrippsiella trochoidea, Strain CCMP3099" /LENGTH=318 /DNA_ID=CAMNT_0002655535 /DNA_START=344 /DNA_END=1301 /DNA_ORIENTATION=+